MFRFEHPKDRVSLSKRKVTNDMKEELHDMNMELLQALKISAKK